MAPSLGLAARVGLAALAALVSAWFVREGLMRKLLLTVAATAMIFAPALAPRKAEAEILGGAAKLPPAANVSRAEGAACQGWGPYCPPGFVRACGPYRCWCRPCR